MKKLLLTCAILLLIFSGPIQTRENPGVNKLPDNDKGNDKGNEGDNGGNNSGDDGGNKGGDDGGNKEIDKDYCKSIQSLNQFKAKSILRYNDKEYRIEEIQLEERGRLKVTVDNKETDVYFEKVNGTLNIAYYNRGSKSCEIKKGVATSPHTHQEPYRFYNSQSRVFGPTGLWSKVADSIPDNFELKEDPEHPLYQRGIRAHRCEAQAPKLFDLGESAVTLTVSDPDWLIFDQTGKKVPEPLSLKVESQKVLPEAPKGTGFAIITVDYLSFETIDPTEQHNLQLHEFDFNEDYWITPSTCESFSKEEAPIQIPSRFQMTVERLDEVAANAKKSKEEPDDGNNETGGKEEPYKKNNNRTKILIDKQDGFKGYINENEDQVQIYEESHKLLFEINPGLFCKSYYQETPQMDTELFELFDELSETSKQYRAVGTQMVRDIRTNVFRKLEKFEGQKVLKVATLYLQEHRSEANSELLTHDPAQIRFEEFKMNEETGNYDLVGSLLYNFFDFESFKNDDELVKALDLVECIDQSNVAALSIVAKRGQKEPNPPEPSPPEPSPSEPGQDDTPKEKLNKQDDNADRKDEETELKSEVKKTLRELLVKATGQTVIAFPKFKVETYPEEVIAHFTFVDIINPLAYFVKPKKELRNKLEPDNKVRAETETECASKALKEKTCFGYEYCKDSDEAYCDLLNEKMLGSNKTDTEKCVIRKKIDGAKEEPYKTTNEKIDDIRTAAKSQALKLTHNNEELAFEQFHLIEEEAEIDRSKLYHRRLEKSKISDQKSNKKLKLEDGVTSLQSCFEACSNPENGFTCDTFSFCKRFDVLFDCNLAELNRGNVADDNTEYFEADENCHVYKISAVLHFEEHQKKQLKDEDEKGGHLRKFGDTDSDECAQDCLNYNQEKENEKKCLSIEVCETGDNQKTCRLNSKSTLWKGEEEVVDNDSCNVYSVKHLLNFHPTAKEKLTEFLSETVDSIDQCATACSVGDCKKFNYCKREDRAECRYVSDIEDGERENTDRESDEIGCVTYVRRDDFITDLTPGSPKNLVEEKTEKRFSGKGYKRGTVTGFVFLFLFIGMFVGVGGLYAKKRFLNGGSGTDGGENATITFSNLNRENDE